MRSARSSPVAPSAPGQADGFSGQRIVVLPPAVTRRALAEPLFSGLLPTDIGWYPAARGHRPERPVGVGETIFLHCLSDSGWIKLRGARHTVNTGNLVAIPPGEDHAYAADPRRPWTLRWFHLAGRDLPPFSANSASMPPRPSARSPTTPPSPCSSTTPSPPSNSATRPPRRFLSARACARCSRA